MTTEERTKMIESYGDAYEMLIAALEQYPVEMWKWKPSHDRWSIHESIIHIADSEANSYIRCRRFIAEPGRSVLAYDENTWAKALKYEEQSTGDALELFHWLRANTYKLIKTLPEATWSNTVEHFESGTITFDEWLQTYEHHIPEHIAEMQKIYDEWLRHGDIVRPENGIRTA